MLDVQPDADPDIDLQFIGEDKTLSAMLADGEIDALLGARRPNTFGVSPQVQRLFPDYRKVEQDYYRDTGLFPIMHTVVLKEELHRQHPWVARSLFQAMERSKEWVMTRMRNTGTLRFMLPWMFEDLEEMDRVFEGDPVGIRSGTQSPYSQYPHGVLGGAGPDGASSAVGRSVRVRAVVRKACHRLTVA